MVPDLPHDARPAELPAHVFLAGGGEMGALIRAHHWAATPLGEPARWPAALRTVMRILLTTHHPVFLFWGPQHTCVYNDAYRRSLGPEKHPSMLGAPGREAWEEAWPTVGPQLERVMAGGPATWHENQLVPIHRHGRLEDVYWTYSYGPVHDETAPEGIGGVLVLCTETTDRMHALQRERERAEELEALMNSAPAAMWIAHNRDCSRVTGNPQTLKLLETTPPYNPSATAPRAPGEHRHFREMRDGLPIPPEDLPMQRAARTGRPVENVEIDFVFDDGRVKHVYGGAVPLHDADGAVRGAIGAFVDITAFKQARAELECRERQLREADRRKDEFLATLAHELRNPLAPLRTGLEILAHGPQPGTDPDAVRRMMQRQLTHMVRLIDDLLDVSRISSGKLMLQCEPIALSAAIDAGIEAARPAIVAGGHRLVRSDAPEPLVLEADLTRLAQVLANLLHNAAKYTPAGGRIVVETAREGGEAVLRVSDDGIGIPPEQLDEVFRMFSQVDLGLQRSQGGLGIGLALARSIVELHGGTLVAMSDGPGHGSCFAVRLPLAKAAGLPLEAAGDEAPAAARGLRVLVVDDNVDAADSLTMLLALQGHEARAAHDGPQALAVLRDWRADIALLDLGLPGMSGYELARTLRAADGAVPQLVALTGWGSPLDAQRTREAGFAAHLTKPVAPETMLRLLGDLSPA